MTENYICEVVEVRSGDDIIAMVNLGFEGLYKKTRLRLLGVDTPDAYKSPRCTEAGGVRDKVKSITTGKLCRIHVSSRTKSSWVVTLELTTESGVEFNLNRYLIDKGYVYTRR